MISRLTVSLCLLLAVTTYADIHVSPTGDDTAAGSAAAPVATLARAAELVTGKTEPQTIIIHEGTYTDGVTLRQDAAAPPQLLITAAPREGGGYAEVIFDGGHHVKEAEAVEGMPGVYRTKYHENFNSYQSRRTMWEADSRVRYRGVADVRAVGAWPSSYRFADDGYVYFHTSDGRPPSEHDVGYDISDDGISVWWDNVTVQGLKVRNGMGVGAVGNNITIRDCDSWNNDHIAFSVSSLASDAKVINCSGRDVGAGVKSNGVNTLVEGCTFYRIHDAFESHLVTQDASGVQFYHPAKGGAIRNNLLVGFHTGVFVKGVYEAVVIEGNTAVGGDSYGIGVVHWRDGTTMRNNIVSDYHGAYFIGATLQSDHGFLPTGVFRDNLFWNIEHWENVKQCMILPQAAGSGQGIIMADPRFASPADDDYRLQSDSPALASTSGAAYMGARGKVGDGWTDTQPPQVKLTAAKPATLLGRTVEKYFEQDHWHENPAARELRETVYEPLGDNVWLLPSRNVKLKLLVRDNASTPAQMKLRIGDGAWSEAKAFAPEVDVELPTGSARATIAVQVADAAGNWSQAAELQGYVTADAPQVDGDVATYANDHGFAVALTADIPCFAQMQWSLDETFGNTVEQAANNDFVWSAGDGGEWTTRRIGQRRDHHFAVVAPTVSTGQTVHYRFVLDDGLGHVTTTPAQTVTIKGAPRTLHVSTEGVDAEHADAPLRTAQFAVNRALPGDRVILHDGVYTESATITHGGTADAPLIIEAQNKWGAAFDGGKHAGNLLEIYDSPYVELRGIEFRWWSYGYGVQMRDSPHVTIDQCKFWNNHLIKGRKTGVGFYARHCPDMTVTGSLFYFMNQAFCILDSPRFFMSQNTAASMLHRGCRIIFSCEGSTFINNSFTFTGNDHLQGLETQSSWASFTCDYNNFAAIIRERTLRRPEPEHDIERWSGSHWAKQSKGVNYINILDLPKDHPMNVRCFSLQEWQQISGKDAHSIYKRPMYVEPFAMDFRLRPDSPNIGAGKDGATIGALGPVE